MGAETRFVTLIDITKTIKTMKNAKYKTNQLNVILSRKISDHNQIQSHLIFSLLISILS